MEKEEKKTAPNNQEEIKLLTYNPEATRAFQQAQLKALTPEQPEELEWWQELLLSFFGGQYESKPATDKNPDNMPQQK